MVGNDEWRVFELYCFYGKREEVEKFYQFFNKKNKNEVSKITEVIDNPNGNSEFKVELESLWTTCADDYEQLIKNSQTSVALKMCSVYAGKENYWSFNDDLESNYLPENYVVILNGCLSESDFYNIGKKFFYTENELKQVLDEYFEDSKPLNVYIEQLDDYNQHKYERIGIKKIQKGNRNDLLLCRLDKSLVQFLKCETDFEYKYRDYERKLYHSKLYQWAWLNKYGKDKNYISYSQIGNLWNHEKKDKAKAFYWYVEGAKNKEIFSLEKMGEGYEGSYGEDFFKYVTDKNNDEKNTDKAINYYKEAYKTYCDNQNNLEYCAKEMAGKAALNIGLIYKDNKEESNEYFNKAMEIGNKTATLFYSINLFCGFGVNADKEKAIELLEGTDDNDEGIDFNLLKLFCLGEFYTLMGRVQKAALFYQELVYNQPYSYILSYSIQWLQKNGFEDWLKEKFKKTELKEALNTKLEEDNNDLFSKIFLLRSSIIE